MPILDPDELDELQADVAEIYEDTMPDLLFIQRTLTATRDPENPEVIVSETPNKIYDDVPCRYRALSPREKQLVAQTASQTLIEITMSAIYAVIASDSGQIYAKGETGAINFEIVGESRNSNAMSLRVLAEVV